MIKDSTKLRKGQLLKVDIKNLNDRFPPKIVEYLSKNPIGELIGYKVVDANQFGLVIRLHIGKTMWFFENELSEIE